MLPLAVDDELVLVVPVERSRSANTPRPARQGFPVRADGRSSRRAGAPIFAAGRQAQVCGVQAVRRGRALRRGRAKAGGCGRDAPGRQVADDRKHFAASGAVRGHGYGCQPVSEGAAHVDLARVRRECECNKSSEPGVSHSARRRGTGARRGRHTCRPPYGQTNRVGTSSLVCCGACCMAASRKALAEPPTTHAECGCRGPGATGRAGQSTSASSVSTTWGDGWVCFGGGAPTAGISHVARPFSAMLALARHDATPAASSSTAGEAGHSVQSRGTSHCADWQSLFQPGGLSAFALTRLPSYCCIDAHLGDRSPLRGGWRDVLPFKGCSG